MKKTPQHIVFLTPGFPANKQDSTTIPALQDYLIALKKELPNTKMTVIAFQYPFSQKKYLWQGYQVIPLQGENKKIKKLFIWRKALKTLTQLHQENPIHTIHSFWIGECSYIGEKFNKKHNIKHIVTAMGQDVLTPNRYAKSLKNKNAKIVTLSKNQSNYLFKNFRMSSITIPWGIHTKNFPEVQTKTIDVLGVGSLNKIKNYILFVQLILELVAIHKDLRVEIIGEGNQKKNIQQEIEKHELQNNITLIGKLPRKEVLKKMASAKLLLHTSSYESFGMVFLEALYLEMKIVSFNVGISKESKHWKISTTKNDMVNNLSFFLKQPKTSKIKWDYFINKTVRLYCKIYNE